LEKINFHLSLTCGFPVVHGLYGLCSGFIAFSFNDKPPVFPMGALEIHIKQSAAKNPACGICENDRVKIIRENS